MESATKTTFAMVDMPLAAEPPDLKRYDENDKMDEGGIVGGDGAAGAKPRRTRRARNGGAGSNVKAISGGSGGGIYLVLNPDKTYREITEGELEEEATESLKDSGRRIVRAVVGSIAKPVVSFGS